MHDKHDVEYETFKEAFYEMAELLGVKAQQGHPPRLAYEIHVRPALLSLVRGSSSA